MSKLTKILLVVIITFEIITCSSPKKIQRYDVVTRDTVFLPSDTIVSVSHKQADKKLSKAEIWIIAIVSVLSVTGAIISK